MHPKELQRNNSLWETTVEGKAIGSAKKVGSTYTGSGVMPFGDSS
jgi:hypothetical protein